MSDPTPAQATRFPRQIPFIIGNEAAERFSFYGMRNILTLFLTDYLLRNAAPDLKAEGGVVLHWFVMGVYFFPLIGGFIADRFWGKYRTILWLSIVYAAGQALLPLYVENRLGFYAGLFLIAARLGRHQTVRLGVRGRPVQRGEQEPRCPAVFAVFYWSINLGSFFASLLIPKVLTCTARAGRSASRAS